MAKAESQQLKVVIIGNGIAGITAARHIRKLSDHQITVVSSESKYFFSRTALMYVFMGHMRQRDIQPYENWFWEKNKIDLMQDHVVFIDYKSRHIETATGLLIHYDKLVIACGSSSNMLDVPGIDADGVRGLYFLQDLNYINSLSHHIKRAVVAGGGLIGIELAEMLHSRNIPVTFLVRESSFWNDVLPPEESEMINRHIISHGIDLQLNSEIKEIHKNSSGHVSEVITKNGNAIPCDFVGMTIGVHPNVNWLRDGQLKINEGLLVDEFLQTNIEDVYAIGDCAELIKPADGRSSIEQVWYTGRIMGETLAHTICGSPVRYDPGLWFNSAKFFDIEYQVYGSIQASLPVDQQTFFWKHNNNNACLRINYYKNGAVIGFNALGIRLRQQVCEKWITEKTHIDHVISDIGLALFNPELSEDHSTSIRLLYQSETGKDIKGAKRSYYNDVHRFLMRQKQRAT